MHDSYFLVAIIDNNYIESNLYDIFWEIIAYKNTLENGNGSNILRNLSNGLASPKKKNKVTHSSEVETFPVENLPDADISFTEIKSEDDF